MIISTNAAETAVTFQDCWAVIDTCLVNQMVYDPVAKTQLHATVPCPKTASKQRAGRAGRTIPGINIKLITQQEWDNLPDTEPPQPRLEDPIPIYLRLIRLTGNKEMESNQKLVFSLFMAAIQLIRESRLRPRLMDSVYNFMNIGIMIAPLPMRQVLKDEYQPEQDLYTEDEWEYPIAIHGMVSGAEEERRIALEWQELFGKYKAPAFQLPYKRVYHLQSDDTARAESHITAETSGLNDLGTPIPQVVQHLCHTGLSQQAVTQDHPLDNSQTEAHGIDDEMVIKYRDALRVVREYVNSKKSWVELMTSSEMDDGPEAGVDSHLADPPAQISSIKTRIKSLATGVWALLKRLTEHMAPTVVKTPATSATTAVLEPEIDPAEIGLSVPQNALITLR